MEILGKLLDKPVLELHISSDESVLRFKHYPYSGSDTIICTDSDCCSETWFADITDVHNLLGCKHVIGVEILEVSGPKHDERSRQDVDIYHGFLLKTEKGTTKFVFRNSSNGYYDGCICDVALTKEQLEKIEFRQITEDLCV
jgi:hypothetical protein